MRWLQLCDLHLGRDDEAQKVAMNQLISAIEIAMEDVPIDLVVIAGDLAYSGAASEYERLRDQVIFTAASIRDDQRV